MKKIICIILAASMLILACSLTSCGKKKITVATSPDFPPFEDLDDGKYIGIEMELIALCCDYLGYEFEMVSVPFESIITGVQTGKYTAGVAGISVDEDRKQNVDFATPYCLAAQAIVVKKGSSIEKKADLTGKKISVQLGTTGEKYCQENGYNVSSYETNSDAELALGQGKVDAWVIDDLTAAAMVKEWNSSHSESDALVVINEAMTSEPYAFAFQKGSSLVADFNKAIEKLVKDGTVANLFAKYDAPYTKPEI